MKKNQVENQVFQDKNKKGQDRKWRERKLQNIELGKRLEILGYRQFKNVMHCAEVLNFMKLETGELRLYQTWFCKNKLCPICNWRRAMKHSYQATQVIDKAIEYEPKGRFLFLTLTVKNIDGDALNDEMSKLTESFRRLFKRVKVMKNVIGFLRSSEVTVNQETGLYHPHLHVLLFVKSSYFTGDGNNYISQKEWTSMWQESAQLEYVPIVDVRAIKPKKEYQSENVKDNLRHAVIETAKYPVKPIDSMGKTEEEKLQITKDLYEGLYRKRQLSYGGLFKKIRKELQLEDVENGNLIQVDEQQDSTSPGQEIVARWNWERMNYFVE